MNLVRYLLIAWSVVELVHTGRIWELSTDWLLSSVILSDASCQCIILAYIRELAHFMMSVRSDRACILWAVWSLDLSSTFPGRNTWHLLNLAWCLTTVHGSGHLRLWICCDLILSLSCRRILIKLRGCLKLHQNCLQLCIVFFKLFKNC